MQQMQSSQPQEVYQVADDGGKNSDPIGRVQPNEMWNAISSQQHQQQANPSINQDFCLLQYWVIAFAADKIKHYKARYDDPVTLTYSILLKCPQ